MRIHVQNPAGTSAFSFTRAQWDAAVKRHPDMRDLEVTIDNSDDGWSAALPVADIVLTWVDIVGAKLRGCDLSHAAPRLKLLSCNSAGVDRLAPFDWLPRDIALLNNSGIHADKAGEFGLMALLMLHNNMPAHIRSQHAQRWAPMHATTLKGRTLVIVGLGAIGGGVARLAKMLGMTIVGVRNGSAPHEYCDEVVSVSDIHKTLVRAEDLVLACPLTKDTRNLLSRERIALLPRGARVINIGRGQLWDQDAVCDALDSGHLQYAFTDVAWSEPVEEGHRLWATPGLILTPHIAADDRDRYNDITLDILFENIRAHAAGRPLPNQIDPVRGY
ncbi:D-2-hydroxyacid dehydrogenase [Phyllobacterium endophyticum]|uniref:Hydroxyacid dehydrogenase n=1 Tax=Phyllobacterium endophyticum TaxID=1149773 RepID=A0A2P7AKE4_9HYPH|nr:D-2-hydroxyacid dehydrogenase [Phyllobacterium endophyticum]MBB3237084.1 phosphoglycerate dehydrogenase-like enzyme [Phyllobacterium endophyticum]PSH54679.1 hydroxyacid dehydrogenase [Phyllobacterium endophyticum]TYR40554.1 D-2-hydroxyacid dehydrogenase [Phyllobacterium endophyticum]